MTQHRVLIERLYAALAAGDAAALAEVVADDFVGHLTPGLPAGLGGDRVGLAAMRDQSWWRFGRHYAVLAEPDHLDRLDDGRVLVRGHYRGHGRRSGLPLDAEFTHLITVAETAAGERIVALDQLTDSARFVEALGDAVPLRTIDYSVRDGIARIWLNRPEARNAIDLQLARDFAVAARRATTDAGVRVIAIGGHGPDLTVGGDISDFGSVAPDDLPDHLVQMTTPFHEGFRLLARAEAPIVTVARGAVAGGGLGFLYAGDIVLASQTLRLVTAFGALGLSGDGGGSWWLPKLVGPRRAAELYLRNHPVLASEARERGVVTTLYPDDELDAAAEALLAELAAGPTRGFAGMRRLLHRSWTTTLDEHLHEETRELAASARTSDAAAAVAAFLAKQRPTFEGQ